MNPSGPAQGRLVGVDVARCLALLGMVATHVLLTRDADGDLAVSHSLAGGRASALFAVLAGVSIALLTGAGDPVRGRERAARSAGLVARALLVGLLGLMLAALDSGLAIILTYYAVLFVLALPFLGLGARRLFLLAAGWALLVPVASQWLRPRLPERGYASPSFEQLRDPGGLLSELLLTGYYPALPWLAYLLLGLAIGRLDLRRRVVPVALAVGGAVLAVVASAVSDVLTSREDVARALLLDPPPLGPAGSGAELLELVRGGMYGTTPDTSWAWLLVRAPHSATPFDLVQTAGSAMLVLGCCLVLAASLPAVARRALAILCGAGAMSLTLYSLHVAMRSDLLWPAEEPGSFRSHVLVLGAVGALYAARGTRGPLESVAGAVAGATAAAVRALPARSARRAHEVGERGYVPAMDTGKNDDSQGQVSEVASMANAGEEIDPSDAVAGAPDHSSGGDRADEGTQGPDAPPRHGVPEESNESSR
ncbi:heparan-alpha-glucosaminide N-acetyltransferase domain-containing protein [Nocardioides houyundeii]|uniref:heparan-alpha-glucosaminide N-acetyltransferase domain-containing protein n=1 Tax=Nocardioides houyundeii TaxID=2045452 RepID=UPI000C76EEAF|nr:heparan-alpha-glucosaminide N-acetyltransferase domain-containing protein [Nocardioides houyundeii]